MNKKEYYISELEKIGIERLKNLPLKKSFDFDINTSFQHSDFNIRFKDKSELYKHLGRQAKNRLLKLAGLVGWLSSWYPNYTKSKKISTVVDLNPESETIESELFNKESVSDTVTATDNPPPVSPLCYQSRSDYTYEELPLALHLSRNSKTLQRIYRTPKIVRTVLDYAKDCGLIQCSNREYSMGYYSKKYCVNCEILKQLRELCKDYKIVIPTNFNDKIEAILDKPVLKDSELYYKVRLDKCMRTPGLTEDDISRILTYKYQDVLRPLLSRIDIYNEGRPEQQQMHFNFNVHIKNGYNIKNGCRAWSYAGLLKTEKKAKNTDDPKVQTFEAYFEKEFGSKPWEYDVHSSVFKINRAFNKGIWDEENSDAYKIMFNGVNRKIAKNIAMLYMFEYSGKKLNATIGRSCPEYKKENKDQIDDVMRYWYGHVFDYMGESLNNLVFLLEDSFYSTVDVALTRKGYKFIRKFDCWAFASDNHPEESEMNKLLSKCFKTWYNQECIPLKSRLQKIESSGIKEMKNIYNKESYIQCQVSLTSYTPISGPKSFNNMKKNSRKREIDNSDIPDSDEKLKDYTQEIKTLQKYVLKCILTPYEAAKITKECYHLDHVYKESVRGHSIEDKLEHKPERLVLRKMLSDKYQYKFIA